MKTCRGVLAVSALCVLLAAAAVTTSSGSTVRALGEAGAASLSGRGTDAPWGNPATLAWDDGLYVRIASGSGLVQNDTYTWHDYGRWNGIRWSEADKREILGRIGEDGLHGRFEAGLSPPGIARSGWALTGRNVQTGRLRIPREYADLVLFGNRLGQSVDLPGSTGDGIQLFDVAVSHGRSLGSLSGVAISAGATIHWLHGIRYDEIVSAGGSLTTEVDALDGVVSAETRSANGGAGFALDLATALRTAGRANHGRPAPPGGTDPRPGYRSGVHGPYEVGLVLRNVVGTVRWSGNPRLRIDRAEADSLTLADGQEDDLIETTSRTTGVAPFTRSVAPELVLAGAMWVSQVRLELDWTQGFREGALTSTTPRFALGGSLWRWTKVTPKAGLAVGGIDGPVLALGAQFRVWLLDLDVAYQSVGGIDVSLPKGVALGLAATLRPLGRRNRSSDTH